MSREKYERRYRPDSGLWDAWKEYRDFKVKPKIDRKTYVDICKLCNLRISNKIVKESFEFRMPHRLGFIRIKAIKQDIKFKDGKLDVGKMPVDWATTWKVWREDNPDLSTNEIKALPNKKLIVHVNEHSNGFIMKWYWDKRISDVKNQSAYVFYPVKGGLSDDFHYGRRGLAKWIKSDEKFNEYYE